MYISYILLSVAQVQLVSGSTENEGILLITRTTGQLVTFQPNTWNLNVALVVCKAMGFTG